MRVPRHLFSLALGRFESMLALAVLGGPNITPPDSPFAEQLFGAVMTSAFAAPMVRRRYQIGCGMHELPATEKELILCNLAIRPSALPAALRFQNKMSSNEENLFLQRCRAAGVKMLHCPKLFVYHHRRKNMLRFAAQIASYGAGRAEQTLLEPESSDLRFLIPGLVYVAAPALLVLAPRLGLFLAIIYLLLAATGGFGSGDIRRLGWKGPMLSIPLTLIVHASYGLGLWLGLIRRAPATVMRWYKCHHQKLSPLND